MIRLSHKAALAAVPAPPARTVPFSRRALTVLSSRGALSVALMGGLVALGVHPAHAADTGVVDTYTLDTGAFNGVVTGAGTYLNLLIKNFGVPAILVSLAVAGWGFMRHIAKSAFH